MASFNLACIDRDAHCDWNALKDRYLEGGGDVRGFRSEIGTDWCKEPKTISDSEIASLGTIRELQHKLRATGFMPHGEIDGIYGYRTLSSLRLFQEYVRGIEGDNSMDVDGIFGPGTNKVLNSWVSSNKTADWADPHGRYKKAMAGLPRIKEYFLDSDLKEVKLLNQRAAISDSRAVKDWTFDPGEVHLVGIRRRVDYTKVDHKERTVRENDDLFVLLVNGMLWVFRGSTDPSPYMADRKDIPFLLRGQHEYRNGWHQWSREASYRAFRPVNKGVLVVRSLDGNQLSDASYDQIQEPNPTINIHWSGAGGFNYSAGCQVIAANHYKDFRNETVDLTDRVSIGQKDLSSKKTRGAYNTMLDLVTVFQKESGRKGSKLLYTLLWEEDVGNALGDTEADFAGAVKALT